MKSRILAVVVVALSIGSESRASILSASSEAVREPSTNVVESWNATALQNDLNASLLDAAEASTQAGPLASKLASVSGGGFLVIDGVSSQATYAPLDGSDALEGLFQMERESRLVGGAWDPREPSITRRGRHDRQYDREGDRFRHRHDPYATPEPSTSVLFAAGLLLLGAYVGLRRHNATNA